MSTIKPDEMGSVGSEDLSSPENQSSLDKIQEDISCVKNETCKQSGRLLVSMWKLAKVTLLSWALAVSSSAFAQEKSNDQQIVKNEVAILKAGITQKIEVWEERESYIVKSREQLNKLLIANWYDEATIEQALSDYDLLKQEAETWMLVKYEIVPWYKSKQDLRILVNDWNLLPELKFENFLPDWETELTQENYLKVLEALSNLSDVNEWLRIWNKWESNELSEEEYQKYEKVIKNFKKDYKKISNTWWQDVKKGYLNPEVFSDFIDLFNKSKENIVFPSRETYRRLLVSCASISKYTNLTPPEKATNPKRAAYNRRKMDNNMSSQIWEYSMLTKQENIKDTIAMKVTYEYEQNVWLWSKVYSFLPEKTLKQISENLWLNKEEEKAFVSSSVWSMSRLETKLKSYKRDYKTTLTLIEKEAKLDKEIAIAKEENKLAKEEEKLVKEEKKLVFEMWEIMDRSRGILKKIKEFIKSEKNGDISKDLAELQFLKNQAIVLNQTKTIQSKSFYNMYVNHIEWYEVVKKTYIDWNLITSL